LVYIQSNTCANVCRCIHSIKAPPSQAKWMLLHLNCRSLNWMRDTHADVCFGGGEVAKSSATVTCLSIKCSDGQCSQRQPARVESDHVRPPIGRSPDISAEADAVTTQQSASFSLVKKFHLIKQFTLSLTLHFEKKYLADNIFLIFKLVLSNEKFFDWFHTKAEFCFPQKELCNRLFFSNTFVACKQDQSWPFSGNVCKKQHFAYF